MFSCAREDHLHLPVGTEDGAMGQLTMTCAHLNGSAMCERGAQRKAFCVHCFYAAVGTMTVAEVKQGMDDFVAFCPHSVLVDEVKAIGLASQEMGDTASRVASGRQQAMASVTYVLMYDELLTALAVALLRHVARSTYNNPYPELTVSLNVLLCRLFDLFVSASPAATAAPAEPRTAVRLLGEELPYTGSTTDERVSRSGDDCAAGSLPLPVSTPCLPTPAAAGLLRSMVDLLQAVMRDGERHEVVCMLLRFCDLSVHCDAFLRTAAHHVAPLLTLFRRSIVHHIQCCHIVELLLFLVHRLLCASKESASLLEQLAAAIAIPDGGVGEADVADGDFVTTLCLTLTQHAASEAVLCNALAVLDSALASDTILRCILLRKMTQSLPGDRADAPTDTALVAASTTKLLQLLAPLLLHSADDVRLVACGCMRRLVASVPTHGQRLSWHFLDWLSDYVMEALQRVSSTTAVAVVELLIALDTHEALLVADGEGPHPAGEGAQGCGSGAARLQVFWRLADVPGAAFERLVESPCFESVVRREAGSLNVIANDVLRTASMHPGLPLRSFLTQLDTVARVAQRSEALLPEVIDSIARAVIERVRGGCITPGAAPKGMTRRGNNSSEGATAAVDSPTTPFCLDGLGVPSRRLLLRIVAFLVGACEGLRPLATQLLSDVHDGVVAARRLCGQETSCGAVQYGDECEGTAGVAVFTAILPFYDPAVASVPGTGWQRCFGRLLRDGVVDTLLALAAPVGRSRPELVCRVLVALLRRVFGADGTDEDDARAFTVHLGSLAGDATLWDCSRAVVLGCTSPMVQSRLLAALAALSCPPVIGPAELADAVYAQMQTLFSSLSLARTHGSDEACGTHCLLQSPPSSSPSPMFTAMTMREGRQPECGLQKAQWDLRQFVELASSFVLYFGDLTTAPSGAGEMRRDTVQAAAIDACLDMLQCAPLRVTVTDLLATLYTQVAADIGVVVDVLLSCPWARVCGGAVLVALLLSLPDEREKSLLRCILHAGDVDEDGDDGSVGNLTVVPDSTCRAVPERTLRAVCQACMARWLSCAFGMGSSASARGSDPATQPVFLELVLYWVRRSLDGGMDAERLAVKLLRRLVCWWHVMQTQKTDRRDDVVWVPVAARVLRRHVAPLLLCLMGRTVDATLSAAVASVVALLLSELPATACSELDGRAVRWLLRCLASLSASQVSPHLVHLACLLLERSQSAAIASHHGAAMSARMMAIQRCIMQHEGPAAPTDNIGISAASGAGSEGDVSDGGAADVADDLPCAAASRVDTRGVDEVLTVVLCGLVRHDLDVAVRTLDGDQNIATEKAGLQAWCAQLPVAWLAAQMRGLQDDDQRHCQGLVLRALDVWFAPMRRLPSATGPGCGPVHLCCDDDAVYESVCCVLDCCIEVLTQPRRCCGCACPAARVVFALLNCYGSMVSSAVEVAVVFSLCRCPLGLSAVVAAAAPSVVADVVSRGWMLAALLSIAPYVPWLTKSEDVATAVRTYLATADPPACAGARPGRCGDETSMEEMAQMLLSACDAFCAWTGGPPFATHRFHDLFCRRAAKSCSSCRPYTADETCCVFLSASQYDSSRTLYEEGRCAKDDV